MGGIVLSPLDNRPQQVSRRAFVCRFSRRAAENRLTRFKNGIDYQLVLQCNQKRLPQGFKSSRRYAAKRGFPLPRNGG